MRGGGGGIHHLLPAARLVGRGGSRFPFHQRGPPLRQAVLINPRAWDFRPGAYLLWSRHKSISFHSSDAGSSSAPWRRGVSPRASVSASALPEARSVGGEHWSRGVLRRACQVN